MVGLKHVARLLQANVEILFSATLLILSSVASNIVGIMNSVFGAITFLTVHTTKIIRSQPIERFSGTFLSVDHIP